MSHVLFREAKARLLRFQATEPPVLVFGLRRGGSTMISDTVSANRGVWFANEPFAMFPKRPGYAEKSRDLFTPRHSHFFGLEGPELAQFASFSRNLLKGRYRTMGTSRCMLPIFRANRVCLKILNAPWMLSWFAENTPSKIVVVLRHPGAQAQSVLRQGWEFPVEAYLERSGFLAAQFGDEKARFAEGIFATGDAWRRAILDWVVTSHPLRMATGVYVEKYEKIVVAPEEFVDRVLRDGCGLTDRAEMIDGILSPSTSSRLSTGAATEAIRARNTGLMIDGWRKHITKDQATAGQEILDAFEIDDYAFNA